MVSKVLTTVGLVVAFALPAAAQSTQPPSHSSPGSTSPGQPSSSTGGQDTMAAQQHVKQDLEQAGFTNVQVMPESFLVRAHDKQGRPVMMVINPDSITAVTQVSGSGQSSVGKSGDGKSGGNGTTASK